MAEIRTRSSIRFSRGGKSARESLKRTSGQRSEALSIAGKIREVRSMRQGRQIVGGIEGEQATPQTNDPEEEAAEVAEEKMVAGPSGRPRPEEEERR